jgi:hypothetical protein
VNYDFRLDLLPEGSSYESRYGSLALLASFLRRWPDGAGSAVAIDLLERWSSAKQNRAFPVNSAFAIGMMPGIPGRMRSNPPFKRGFGNCWSLLVRGEARIWLINSPVLIHESGPNATGNGTCRFFWYEIQGTHCGNF